MNSTQTIPVRIGHTPDADDAFMFYAMVSGKINTGPFEIIHVIQDIETLNQRSLKKELEVTAVSMHAYAYLYHDYAVLTSGCSVGDQYGPLVLSKKPMKKEELKGKKVGIPGKLTTAWLVLQLWQSGIIPVEMPFDQIMPAVASGQLEAGVIIHEGQLTYTNNQLHKIEDLGQWWHRETQLPLVLGTNVVKKDLGHESVAALSKLMKESIEYGLAHRKDALDYALQYGRGMTQEQGDRFIEMYVSPYTVDLGEPGKESVIVMFDRAVHEGILPEMVRVEYA